MFPLDIYFSKQGSVIFEWVFQNVSEQFLKNTSELLLQAVFVKTTITAQWILKKQWMTGNLYRIREINKPKIKKIEKLEQYNKTQNKMVTMKLGQH